MGPSWVDPRSGEIINASVLMYNDVVKLAYLTQEQTQEIDTLDLGCLTEFKRNSSGAVEVKLTDRAAVLEKLLEQLKDEENRGAAAFLEALDRPQAPEGMCSRR